MEAYNAYYNNNNEESTDKEKEARVITNIMHINHSGANINITAGAGSQNNFIFNHTAPINLNFYKDQLKAKKEAKTD